MAQLLTPRRTRLRGSRQPIWPLVDPTHPINKGLTGYWALDGQGIGLTPDNSGFGNDGVITAGALRDSSHHGGNALSFNGSTSKVIIPANAAILGATLRSFSCWINTSVTSLEAIFSYGDLTTIQAGIVLFANGSGAGDIYFGSNSGDWHTATGLIATNTWYHVVGVYTGGVINVAGSFLIYVNAVNQSLVQAGGGFLALGTTASAIHIGEDLNTAGRSWSGGIEAFRQYNRALDATEIALLYAEPYAGILDASFSRVGAAVTPPPTTTLYSLMNVG